jgi:uncharacterized protein (DUF1330 family)
MRMPREASSSFLKKRTKKLLSIGARSFAAAHAKRGKVFWFFSSEKNILLYFIRSIPMPAYWVGRVNIHDPVQFKKYSDLVPGIFAKFGAKVLTRGGKHAVIEGDDIWGRHVVVEFPSFEAAIACHDSPEYTAAMQFRKVGPVATSEVVIVEGGDYTP